MSNSICLYINILVIFADILILLPTYPSTDINLLVSLQSFIDSFGEKAANSYSMPDDQDSLNKILMPHTRDMPRQGREDIIAEFWDRFSTFETYAVRRPACMIHGSAGCGKTYLLREIALKRDSDIAGRNLDNIKFIPISYNTSTSIHGIEATMSKNTIRGAFFSLPRIIHSAFLRNAVNFQTFIIAFFEKFRAADIYEMETELKQLLRSKFPGKKFIMLIDELSKLDQFPPSENQRRASEEVRSYLCSLMDGEDSMVSFCLFSSLSLLKLGNENIFNSGSNRQIFPIGSLSIFSFEQCRNIINNCFEKIQACIHFDNKAKAPESLAPKLLEDSVKRIYILSGGHPRTLDTLLNSVEAALTLPNESRCPTISGLHSFILSKEYIAKNIKINETDYCYVRSVLLATSVKYTDKVPGLNGITFDVAVKSGQLVGSNDSNSYTPYLPVINLLNWTSLTIQAGNKDYIERIASKLDEMIKIGMKFNPTDFEKFCYLREVVLSHIRSSLHNYKCIRLRDLYGKGMMGDKKSSLDVTVDATTVLKIYNYQDLSDVADVPSGIFVPTNPRNAGFDYLIRYPRAAPLAANEPTYIDVYFQIKYSAEYSSTKLNNGVITKCLQHCATASRGNQFVLVMYGWRESTENMEAPSNCVLYDRSALTIEFGPTLSQFLSTLEVSPTRFTSRSNVVVEHRKESADVDVEGEKEGGVEDEAEEKKKKQKKKKQTKKEEEEDDEKKKSQMKKEEK